MNHFKTKHLFNGVAPLAAVLLAGCSLAPTYHEESARPDIPATYKEAAPGAQADGMDWATAQPSDTATRGQWWSVFHDTELDTLEQQAQQANLDLHAAAARVAASRALFKAAEAGKYPSVEVGVGATRQKSSSAAQGLPAGTETVPTTLYRAQIGLSYEVDLFNRVGDTAKAAAADAQRSEALYQSVLLALQADVAQNYFALRTLDAEAEILTAAVHHRKQAYQLMQRRHAEGDIDELDLVRAEADLENAKSDALGVARLRALSEHSLALLLGKTPAEFSMSPLPLRTLEVMIPVGMPSTLLQRRPDIAAAERAMAASNARIGVAKSAFFPSLMLTASGGAEASSFGDLFKAGTRTFALGPLAGTALSLPLFDGGRRQGNLDNARAQYDADATAYRQQILTAFREVEDGISEVRLQQAQAQTRGNAEKAASRAAALAHARYQHGAINFLDVLETEQTALAARRAKVQLEGNRASATVNLIRVLGGSWG